MMLRAFPRWLFQPASAVFALALLGASRDAGAVFVFTPLGNSPSITLRVGSADTAVNRVTFTVTGANVSPNRTPVTGVAGNGAPATSPAGGVEIEVATRLPNNTAKQYTMNLTVDSSTRMTCVAATGCGTVVIPLTTVSWTSYNLATGNGAGQDIQSGAFDGSASQPLASFQNFVFFGFGNSVTMRNVLVFQYDNAQLYPSGRYLGLVTYTASSL